MKKLKILIIILSSLALLLIGIGLFLPPSVQITRSIHIDRTPGTIFNQLAKPRHWVAWQPWKDGDSLQGLAYFGPEYGVGAGYEWAFKGKKDRKGVLEFTGFNAPRQLEFTITLGKKSQTRGEFTIEPEKGGARVIWTFNTRFGLNPLKRYAGLIMEKYLGRDLEAGLINLKVRTESLPVLPVEIQNIPSVWVLSTRDTCLVEELGASLATCFGRLDSAISKSRSRISGPPFALYHTWDGVETQLEACLPVDAPVKEDPGTEYKMIPSQTAVVVRYFGPYDGMDPYYQAIDAFLFENDYKIAGPAREDYITDPGAEPDPSRWETRISFPVLPI